MRIISLKGQNVKKIKTIDITPNKYINRISGGNGSGKTSSLDMIEWALTGTSTVPSQPVRKGSGKAVIQLDLGDVVVTRRFTEGGSRNGTLVLEAKDSKSLYQGPQEILDKLMGKISFDPLEFLRMHPKKQFEVLYSLVLPEVDPKTLNIQNHPDYIKRRELKKEKTALETRRDAIQIPDNLPGEKRDEGKLLKELSEVGEYNARIERDKNQRAQIIAKHDASKQKAEELYETIMDMQKELKELESINETTFKIIDNWEPLAKPKDAAHYTEAITAARAINAAIDKRGVRDELQKEIDGIDKRVTSLSDALDEHEERNKKAIEEAHFPVEGLAFGDEEVIYEGIPFNQVSNADQIRASVAIGMESNPKLRVMRIKDGSLLDENSLQIIAEMAWDKDFQIFVECVDTSGKIGVYLEDGEVKAINEEPLDVHEAKPAKKTRAKKIPASA